jgi:hypothetical protein
MPHVQRTSDVGWWQQDAEVILLCSVCTGSIVTAALPELVPAAFYVFGIKGFCQRFCWQVCHMGIGSHKRAILPQRLRRWARRLAYKG